MKAYRNVIDTLPNEFEHVLVFADGEDIAYIAYHDDGYWFESHTGEMLYDIKYWMPIPLLPYQ